MQDVCRRLVDIRESRGLSQGQLAEKAKINRTNLVRMEGGFHAPSLATLVAVLDAMGAKWADLDVPPKQPCRSCNGTGKR